MKKDSKEEQVKISFCGMKLECSNPTNKTIVIIVLSLIFFVVLVVLISKLSVPGTLIKWLSKTKLLSG